MMDFNTAPLDGSELNINSDMLASDKLALRMFNPKLMALRAQMPFINIMPFPNTTISVQLQAGVRQDIQLPDQCKLIRFSDQGVYYVSKNGNAQIPVAGSGDALLTGTMYKPSDEWWYVEEVAQLSLIAAANTEVTIACFTQL
jgi:hypothetical protein